LKAVREKRNMEALERSFRYPLSGEGWGPKFAFGGILYILGSLLGFLPWVGWICSILIAFLPLGYAYKVFRDHLKGSEGPLPAWADWGELFTMGLFVFLLSLGYWIIPGLIYWLGKVLWDNGGFAAFLGVLFIILGLGVGLVAFFLLPMAMAFYVRQNESFSAAYRWSGIVEKIWVVQREYFIGWLASLIFLIVLFFVRNYFLYIGWVIHAFGVFYLSLAAAHLFGCLCRKSMEVNR
jgi:hypothetical protein